MNIAVKGFKSIKDSENIRLNGITMLAGANSSGKSSILQALLMLQQSLDASATGVLNLDGPYVFADRLKDLVFQKKDGFMDIEIHLQDNELPQSSFEFNRYVPQLSELIYRVTLKVRSKSEVYSSEVILNPHNEAVTFMLKRTKGQGCYSGVEPSPYGKSAKYSNKVTFEGIFPMYVDVKDDSGHLLARPLVGFKLMKQVMRDYFANVHVIYPTSRASS